MNYGFVGMGILCCLLAVSGSSIAADIRKEGSPDNIALGRPVVFDLQPNYALCTDENDAKQITDGECYAGTGQLWEQKEAVGWSGASPFIFTVDLGKIQPITGFSHNTGAGVAGVGWPSALLIFVSDDNEVWRYAGDLVQFAARNGLPDPLGYRTYRYFTLDLRTRGRYVRVAISSQAGLYTFLDEFQVYRGPEELLSGPCKGEVVSDIKEFVKKTATSRGIAGRLIADIAAARKAVVESGLNNTEKSKASRILDEAEGSIVNLPSIYPDGFKAIFPLTDTHKRIFSVYAPIMRSQGLPDFFAWKTHRYDPLSPTDTPKVKSGAPSIAIEMMRNEYRADAFLITNASDKQIKADLRIEGLPGAPNPSWLSVSAIPWTDTTPGVPIASALPVTKCANGTFRIALPSGMTQKIWLTADSSKLRPGQYEGYISVTGVGEQIRIPLSVYVSTVKMGRPRLSLGMWDYTDAKVAYGINDGNRVASLKLMRSHFVDTPWGTRDALPYPGAEDFDENNQLKGQLNFDALDSWIKLWPSAKSYLVYAGVGPECAGAKMGTPEFNARVGAWTKALSAHMKALKLKPRQLGILLVDEPCTDEQDEIIAAWANVMKSSAPEITIFTDPTSRLRPDQAKIQDAITKADIICPNLDSFCLAPPEVRKYYADLQAKGHELRFYLCGSPARLLDPDRYYRAMAWYGFRYNAKGIGIWSFGDTGGPNSWNEYISTSSSCSPAFLDASSATSSIHMEAIREGIEDYEYLAMLRDAASATRNTALKSQAEALLAESTRKVAHGKDTTHIWSNSGVDRSLADVYRLRALDLLEKMQR